MNAVVLGLSNINIRYVQLQMVGQVVHTSRACILKLQLIIIFITKLSDEYFFDKLIIHVVYKMSEKS